MAHDAKRVGLAAAAAVLAVAAALFGRERARASVEPGAEVLVASIAPFELASMLARGAPGDVVLTWGAARHPLVGATLVSGAPADDEALVASAPKARQIVLAGADPARVERLARRLVASGRSARVLAGGLGAWDAAMDADPVAPAAGAAPGAWDAYRVNVALRRRFGEAGAQPAPVVAPVAPAAPAPATGGGAKKREGC